MKIFFANGCLTLEARQFAREQFQNAPQSFKGAIGAIDCTHVVILASRKNKEAYINHNGYHSINVQMVLIAIIFINLLYYNYYNIMFITLDMRPEYQDPEHQC